MQVEVPMTVIEAEIKVILNEELPVLLREEGVGVADSTVGDLTLLQPENVLTTDLLVVTREGAWNRKMPLSTLISMAGGGGGGGGGASGLGEGQYDPLTGAGGNTVQLEDKAASIYSALPIPVLNLRMPAVFRNGQECMVTFRQRVQALNLLGNGTDSGNSVTCSNQSKPARAIQPGTVILFRYNRTGSTYWADYQWHIVGVWSAEDPAFFDPVRDFGAVFDGVTVVTAAIQAAWTAAAKPPPAGYSYGSGGNVVMPPGVARSGPLSLSRRVTVEFLGALTSCVLQADYSSLNGVPGEDAMISMLDDGIGQSGLIVQGKLINIAIDGRRSDIGDNGQNTNPMRAHIRHGILVSTPDDGTDRVFASQDLQIVGVPGDALRILNNSQVRGGNWKITNCRRIYFYKCKDSKIDQIGFGAQGPDHNNAIGNLDDLLGCVVMQDCASMKIGRLDIWTGPKAHAIPLLAMISCAKTVIDEGEIEGMCLITGDNNNGNSKAYRQVLMHSFSMMNWKVSSDLYAAYIALGRTANVLTGAGYVAHLKCIDANGVRALECSAGYKLGKPDDGAPDNPQRVIDWPETPPVFFWIGTAIDPGDPQYADYLKACGDIDITGTSLTWWEGKDSPGGRRSRSVYGFKEHISNNPPKLKNLRLGEITWRPVGTQMEDEIALDGAQYTTAYDKGLLYLRLDSQWASGNWAAMRKLTDRDLVGPGADPVTGYVTFNVWNWTAEATRLSTLYGQTMMAYMVYKQ